MIFLFCVDTSASANQRTATGVTLLDVSKAAIEYFMMKRAADPGYRNDRFFLVTFEDGLAAIKAGWGESTADFLHEVKTLQAYDLSDLGSALKKSFDLINGNRLTSNVDTHAMGRSIWSLEPSVVILLTEAGALMDQNGNVKEFMLPAGSSYSGSELYREPFRWDQRLYSVLLRFPGSTRPLVGSSQAHTMISPMCEATGGKCLLACHMKQLMSCLDSIILKHSSGSSHSVALNFEPSVSAGTMVTTNPLSMNHQLIFIKPNATGFWPIPEDYTVIPNMSATIPRFAHPNIKYRPYTVAQPIVPPDFPMDVYPLDRSPLTEWILANCKKGYVLECSVHPTNDPLTGPGVPPFGYLRPQNDVVYLCVLPFHYPQLFLLLNSYQSNTPKWKADFDRYLANIPSYYVGPLKAAFKRWTPPSMGILSGPPVPPYNLITDASAASCKEPPYSIVQYLKTMKERSETERSQLLTALASLRRNTAIGQQIHGKKSHFLGQSATWDAVVDFKNMKRGDLLFQLDLLRTRLFSAAEQHQMNLSKDAAEEAKHRVPISEMGDYQAYLARKPPALRTIEETIPDKPHFGSPFAKRGSGSNNTGFVDEADMPMGEANAMQGGRKRKRSFGRPDKTKLFKITGGEAVPAPSSSSTTSSSSSTIISSSSSSITSAGTVTPSTSSASASASSTAVSSTVSTPNAVSPVTSPSGIASLTTSHPSKLPHTSNASHSKMDVDVAVSSPSKTLTDSLRTRKQRQEKLESMANMLEDVVLDLPTGLHENDIPGAHKTNTLRLLVTKALKQPVKADLDSIRQCYKEIRGGPEIKKEVIHDWIRLGWLFKRSIASFLHDLEWA